MIKKLAALMVAVLMIFSVTVLANGPLLGMSTIPDFGMPVALSFGYDFGDVNIEVWTPNLVTPSGAWVISGLWTPQLGNFGYRIGTKVVLDYDTSYDLGIAYDGFGFVIGVSNTWGPIQLFCEFDIMPFGVLTAVPIVGVNFLLGS